MAKRKTAPEQSNDVTANRNYKDTVFSLLFNHKEPALSALNAIARTDFPPETPVEIVTLDNALYKNRINDLAFLVGNMLIVLIEHQSTKSENITLRFLLYVTKEYEKLFQGDDAIYSERKAVTVPRPVFIVLYNGTDKMDAVSTKRLSELYPPIDEAILSMPGMPGLELTATIYNINAPENADMVRRSEYLHGYVYLIERVRKHQSAGQIIELAIKNAIIETKKAGLIVDFLVNHESEVINMLFYEYDREKDLAYRKMEGIQIGEEQGDKKRQKAVAFKMLRRNKPIEEILEFSELPLTEVLSIKKELEGK